MAAKRMVIGDCITRIVGSKILEELAFDILRKYGTSAKGNIISALTQYMEYEPHKLSSSNAIKKLIQKIAQL